MSRVHFSGNKSGTAEEFVRLCLLRTVRDKGVFVCGKAIFRMFHCLCIRKNKCSGKRSIIMKTPDCGGVSVILLESGSVLNAVHLIHEQINKAHRQN